MPSFEDKLKAIEHQLYELRTDAKLSNDERQKLLSVLEDAKSQIQTPTEYIWRTFFQPHEFAVIRIATQLNLPTILHERGPSTLSDLASQSGANEVLLVRIMRPLCALGIFKEAGPFTYTNGPISSLLATDRQLQNGLKFMWDMCARCVIRFPDFLASIDYQNPVIKPDNFEFAFGPGSHLFPWLGAHPETLSNFQDLLAVWVSQRVYGYDVYPMEGAVAGYCTQISPVLLVDVGGGYGHDVQEICKRLQTTALIGKVAQETKLILQDLPDVIASAPPSLATSAIPIEGLAHDFFTPQPSTCHHAKLYFLHNVLHDWDDERSIVILTHLRDAMKAGYSRILINDWVLPETGASLFSGLLDINMASLTNGFERSEQQFRDLIARVDGLKIDKIWGKSDAERVVEISREV